MNQSDILKFWKLLQHDDQTEIRVIHPKPDFKGSEWAKSYFGQTPEFILRVCEAMTCGEIVQQSGSLVFHSDINSALQSFLELELRESQAHTFKGLAERFDALVYHLNQTLSPFNFEVETKKREVSQ